MHVLKKATAIHRGRTIETGHRALGQRPKIDPFTTPPQERSVELRKNIFASMVG